MGNVLAKIFSVGAKELVTSVTSGLDGLITNKEEREAAKLAVQQEVNRHLESLQATATKELELQHQNTNSARTAEVERMKILGRADWFQYLIGIIPVLGLPALVYYVMNNQIPERNEHLAMLIIGEVLGFVGAIYNYHYGSSVGSRLKDMRDSNPKQPQS
jgi:hypothetical protein